ncbi:MAG TPA: C25 family cysteine peptidase [Candidatus Marinimicrobia bacterium]|jgi:PKD repeat protein|nr:C25 family cysteine peptidase [Candidatus Neomarinimicrobiota bacterium]MDP6261859.1 C25 family cysteine peptidase [Candidatus Neomarinimicrobiota bacterium]MDP7127983.1 C25 family cysteine peptidase [Candidatus Neomarinimicrobiota bacterium]MDP7337182.1 C25 family cysteine peptidase [Candidatus Neomarinimicrobiota bacterium]MDP7475639.1 C25 family cysteine peptidase [Candidatus Neomarinimicrobiota bacterium]
MIKRVTRSITAVCLLSILCSQFTLQDGETGKTLMNFTPGDVSLETQGEYTKFIPLNGGTTTDYGRPELPLFSTLVQVEPGREYDVSFSVVSSHIIPDIKVFPFQNKEKTEALGVINYMDASFYEEDAVYPGSVLQISDRLVMRDLNLLNISVVPYRYNPVQRTLEVIDEMEIEVTESGEREDEGRSERLPSRVFEQLYSTLVLNYEDRDRDTEFQDPAILYICGGNSESNPYFQQLVDWRHQRGYVVYTASLSETGSSSYSIKNYIQDAYDTYSPPPEYVALVGDVGGSYNVPTYYEGWGHNNYGSACEGDHPFSQLDGDDLFPEVLIGRISVRSTTDLAVVVNKILNYEKGTYASSMLSYFEKAALIGDPNSSSGISTVITNEYIEQILNTYGFEDVRIKTSGGSWASWMQNQLNEGVLYFNYRGTIGVSGFGNSHIDAANNGYMLPLATVITCGTGSFAEDQTCISEKFLRAGSVSNPKGGIAGISTSTWNTHTLFNNIFDMGVYDGIFTKNIETAGGGLAHGKLVLFNAYPTNPYNWINAFTHWNNLMGDPATHLWTDTPEYMNVQFEEEIPFGTNFLDVNAHVYAINGMVIEDAMVTVHKDNDEIFFNAFTDNDGKVTLDLSYDYGGEVNITVTKRNFIPFTGSFEITITGKLVNVDPTQESIVDDGEGGNGIFNPGETVDLQIPLKNFGSLNVTGIQAFLESTSPFVTLIDSSSSYGIIDAGESSFGDGFTMTLDPSALEGEDLGLRIHIEDDQNNQWAGAVPLVVKGGYIVITNDAFIEKNQTIDIPVSIQNNGSVTVENVMGELTYSEDFVEVVDGDGSWGDIQPEEAITCLDCFTISMGNDIVNGTLIPLTVRFYNADGYNNQQTLTLQIGEVSESDPMGPDAYGYYIYDMADTEYGLALEYDWYEIDPGHGGSGTDLNLSDNGNGNFSNSSEVVDLPFTFRFYGIDYEKITVNSNGWIAMGESDLESFRNYPVPGAGGPSPMIAAFWDDLKTSSGGDVFRYFDPANQFAILEWSDMRTHNQNSVESFQVILYNSQAPPYGDGNIKIQYKIFNNTSSGYYGGGTPTHGSYCTIGIENHMSNDGLEYTFDNVYAPAATELDDGSALFITTYFLEAPTAFFDFEVDNSTVFFTDLSMIVNSIELTDWAWDFGDGNYSSEPSPAHYYTSPGVYQVSLVVTSSFGLESDPYMAEVVIESCTDPIDDCGVCGGDNVYVDCNGQCGEWTPICTDESYDGYMGSSACEGYIGIGSEYPFADNGGLDDCGECEGDNSTCIGCTDPIADNYDPGNIIEDESCTYVFYGPGQAVRFDGEDDYIEIAENDLSSVFDEGSEAFTVSAWINPVASSPGSGYNVIISHSALDVFSSSFMGEYYSTDGAGASPPFGDLVLVRPDEVIDFNWGNGSPDPSIPNDDYQVRWTGSIHAETTGVYNFRSYTDDGVRLYIGGAPVLNHWYDQSATSRYGSIYLTAGMYECVMEYYENGGDAVAQLYWTPPGGSETLVQPAISTSSRNFEMGVSSLGNLEVKIMNSCGDNILVLGGGELQPEDWHHLALTFSTSNVTAYLDGNVYEAQTCGNTLAEAEGAVLSLGASVYDDIYFAGILDEVRIWDHAREFEEIQADMHDRIDPLSEGLAGYWRFDEAEGNITFDATAGNNDGLLNGAPERIESTVPFTMPPFITLTAVADTLSWPIHLQIGIFPDATEGYDYWIDLYAPPAPPPPSWDAALYNFIVNDRFYIDMRPVPSAGWITEWAVDFQMDVGTQEVTLSWNVDELGEGTYTLMDAVGGVFFSEDMKEMESYSFPSSFNRVIIRHSFSTGMTISYTEGWNMVGLPLGVEDASYNLIFPESIEGTLYSFDDGYTSGSDLTPGEGYWLRFENAGSTVIDGTPINELTLSLNEDWNLVSGLSEDISIYSVLDPDSILVPGTLYGFNDGYVAADMLSPGNGYWLRAFQSGDITLTSGGLAKVKPHNFSLKGKANSLSISGSELYFGIELSDKDRLSYSLPPKPPPGAFDVRFSGDTRIMVDKAEIEVMSPHETITISYDVVLDAGEYMHWVLSTGSGGEHTLEGTGEITVPTEETFTLERKAIIPIAYALHQNYPNPFNPTTTLRYDLPVDNHTTLTIYDLNGREVNQIVNTSQPAGHHSVMWNATNSFGKPVSAGVYLYQIRAGEFVQTRKMVLLK